MSRIILLLTVFLASCDRASQEAPVRPPDPPPVEPGRAPETDPDPVPEPEPDLQPDPLRLRMLEVMKTTGHYGAPDFVLVETEFLNMGEEPVLVEKIIYEVIIDSLTVAENKTTSPFTVRPGSRELPLEIIRGEAASLLEELKEASDRVLMEGTITLTVKGKTVKRKFRIRGISR